jgi:hypothetical protein
MLTVAARSFNRLRHAILPYNPKEIVYARLIPSGSKPTVLTPWEVDNLSTKEVYDIFVEAGP